MDPSGLADFLGIGWAAKKVVYGYNVAVDGAATGLVWGADKVTFGCSTSILGSREFGYGADSVDGFFAGWGQMVCPFGALNDLREALHGEAATRNHGTFSYRVGTWVGTAHNLAMMVTGLHNLATSINIGGPTLGGGSALAWAPGVSINYAVAAPAAVVVAWCGASFMSVNPTPPPNPQQGQPTPITRPWANMGSRNLRRWLESLETQAAQNPGAAAAGRLRGYL